MRGGYCGRASSPIGLSGWPTGACAISVAAGGEFDEGDQQLQQQAERDPRPHRPPPVAEAAGVPVVTGISPSSGLPEGGTTVTLTGSGFTGASAVHFGSTSGVNAVVVRDTQLTVISPPGTGVVDVTVTGAGGTSSTAAADSFAYGAPVVTGITPADGPPTGGTVVTVSGDNLTGATAVNFGSTLGLNLVMISNTQLTVVSPPGTGVVDLTITGVGGTSSTSAADRFSYAPIVTAIAPNSGDPSGGTTVTVSGSNFTGFTSVNFGNAPGLSPTVSGTRLTVVSPPGTGVVHLTVTGPGGISATTPADFFAYGEPVVSAVSPADGPPTGGTVVTVTGNNLNGATAVNFGNTPGLNLIAVSDTQLSVISPPGTGKVDVTVKGVAGTSTKSPKDKFSYAPTVRAISPTSGPAAGGTTVTIAGSGYTGASDVNFGSTPGTPMQRDLLAIAAHLPALGEHGLRLPLVVVLGEPVIDLPEGVNRGWDAELPFQRGQIGRHREPQRAARCWRCAGCTAGGHWRRLTR